MSLSSPSQTFSSAPTRLVVSGLSQIPATHMLASGQKLVACDYVVNGLYYDFGTTFKQIPFTSAEFRVQETVAEVIYLSLLR